MAALLKGMEDEEAEIKFPVKMPKKDPDHPVD